MPRGAPRPQREVEALPARVDRVALDSGAHRGSRPERARDAPHGAADAARRGRPAAPRARARPAPRAGRRLRGLPHRSARRRRRAAAAEAPPRPRARDGRARGRARRGGDALRDRRPGRRFRGSAGRAAICPACRSGRENLCPRARFTGYDARRRLRGGGDRRRAVSPSRSPTATATRRRRRSSARGSSGIAPGRRCGGAAPRPLRFRRRRPHRRAARAPRRPGGLRLHPRGGRRGAGVRALARRGAGRAARPRRRPSRSTPRSSSRPWGRWCPRPSRATAPGGTVVCAGIHMSDIPSFPYALLWGERTVRRSRTSRERTADELLALAPTAGVRTEVDALPARARRRGARRPARGPGAWRGGARALSGCGTRDRHRGGHRPAGAGGTAPAVTSQAPRAEPRDSRGFSRWRALRNVGSP